MEAMKSVHMREAAEVTIHNVFITVVMAKWPAWCVPLWHKSQQTTKIVQGFGLVPFNHRFVN